MSRSYDIPGAGSATNQPPEASRSIEEALLDTPAEGATVDWLLRHLSDRSPEILFLAFTPVAVIPATSPLAGAVLLVIAIPLIFHRRAFPVPAFLSRKKLSRAQILRAFMISELLLRRYEAFALVHPHPPSRHHTRLTGVLVATLSSALLVPIPFSNVLPGLTIGTVAVASLEQDGRLFLVGSFLTAISLLLVLLEALVGYHLIGALS
jgi:hypothetical protein